MDLNVDPRKMAILSKAIESKICYDILLDAHEGDPPPTYRKGCIEEGMSGFGTSRIDTVLANPTAANLFDLVEQLYTSAKAFDHTPIECSLSCNRFHEQILVAEQPAKLDLPDTSGLSQKQRSEYSQHNNDKFKNIWKTYENSLKCETRCENVFVEIRVNL